MKVGNTPRGSFGVPENVREEHEKQIASNREQRGKEAGEAQPPVSEEEGFITPSTTPAEEPSDDPIKRLKELGVDLTPDDFYNCIFRGFIEKDVTVIKNKLDPNKSLVATIRTVTAEELELIDELLAEEMATIQMSRDGVDSRRNVWILAFSVVKLNGKPLATPVKDSAGNLNQKESAKLYKKTLLKLSPAVVNAIGNVQTLVTTSINLAISRHGADFLAGP